jgi:hypothetical protein
MKNLTLIILSLVTTSVFAGAFDSFMPGLQRDYFFTNTARGIELANHVRVAKFGPLDRVLSPDAVATYNGNLNTIKLDETLLEKVGNETRVRDARLIRGTDRSGIVSLSTIFHEMGHAEMDVFIENRRESQDEMVYSLYQDTLKPFYKANFPGTNPNTIFQELFGYYRGDLLDFYNNEIVTIMINNGFNMYNRSCFVTQEMKKRLAEGVPLEAFKQFFTVGESAPYGTRVFTRYVYVRGKDIDLSSVPNGEAMLKQAHYVFWLYHQKSYGFPVSQAELVMRMNATSEYKKTLEECRTKIWTAAQAPKP